jgi:CubicO group peptidase (beta-lactamase class C family)
MPPRHSLLVALLAATPALAQPTPQGSTASSRAALIARIDSLANDFVREVPSPSVAIAVVRGSDTLVMKGYGFADVDAKRPATATTIYRIGSLTKQFTSAGIMRLVERGKVSLDDDLSKYVPSFPLQGHHVTIRHLLTHTSGVHNYTSMKTWQPTWAIDLTPDSIVGFVKQEKFDFAPGDAYSYSNTGYVLLGMVIEKVSGKPYAQFVEEELFKPLKLTQTSYCPSRPTDPAFAAGYARRDSAFVAAPYLSLTHPHAAGALCSSVSDFVRWQRALAGGKVVSPASYTLMTTPAVLNNGKSTNYGFGLTAGMVGTHRVVTHSGGINGFTTSGLYFPDDTLNVVVFDNSGEVNPGNLSSNIARVLFGMPLVQRPRPVAAQPLPASRRDAFVGTYVVLSGRDSAVFNVRAQGEGLVAEIVGQGTSPMIYAGNDTFGLVVDPTIRLVFVVEGDRATKLRFARGGTTMEGPRRP